MWTDKENIITKNLKKMAKKDNPKGRKTTFTSRYKCGLKGKDGFQSLSF